MPDPSSDRPDDAESEAPRRARPFWSGTIAFGLVSLPVSLFAANRPSRASLRMVDADGAPLARRYVSADGEELEADEIVRGRGVDDGTFVVVEDDELESLAPEKSHEIDLTRFVELRTIEPTYFERSYFLAPDRGAQRAYRLLAKTMEASGRAGIATFVMRGKEYLVAIIAERGILRAETLRFHDELRSPTDVGLPGLGDPEAAAVRRIERAIERIAADELDRSLLRDRGSRSLLELVDAKLAAGEGVVELPEERAREGAVDVMELLRRSLEEDDEDAVRPADGGDAAGGSGPTKAELYEHARRLDIAGRSSMTKQELADAIADAQ